MKRVKELREKDVEALKTELEEAKAELRKYMAQIKAGVRPENVGRVKELKKKVARIITVLKEKGVVVES